MRSHQLVVAMALFLLPLACAGGDEWGQAASETGADDVAVSDDGRASEGAGAATGEVVLGQSEQAIIGDSCFEGVPPFVQASDFFTLEITGVARPRSTCQGADARFVMVDNLVKDLGIPVARPTETAAEDCADREIFVAVGLYGEDSRFDAQVIFRGSKRGRVVVRDDGVLFCDLTISMQPNDLDDMPDGRDYIFVAQVLSDLRQNDFSEDVSLFNVPVQ